MATVGIWLVLQHFHIVLQPLLTLLIIVYDPHRLAYVLKEDDRSVVPDTQVPCRVDLEPSLPRNLANLTPHAHLVDVLCIVRSLYAHFKRGVVLLLDKVIGHNALGLLLFYLTHGNVARFFNGELQTEPAR